MHPFPLGALMLILHGPHLLPGLLHLNTIPNLPINHFSHILLHNLSGMHHPRGGGPHTTNIEPYCLHLHLNHNSFTLIHISNPRCLLNQIWTWTIDRHNRSIVGKHLTLPMLWKFKKSTLGLEESFQIINLHLHLRSLKRKRRRVFLKPIHLLFLID